MEKIQSFLTANGLDFPPTFYSRTTEETEKALSRGMQNILKKYPTYSAFFAFLCLTDGLVIQDARKSILTPQKTNTDVELVQRIVFDSVHIFPNDKNQRVEFIVYKDFVYREEIFKSILNTDFIKQNFKKLDMVIRFQANKRPIDVITDYFQSFASQSIEKSGILIKLSTEFDDLLEKEYGNLRLKEK